MASARNPHAGDLLVVDDNRVNRLLLGRGLEEQGHSVEFAEHGGEALDLLGREQFDLLLLDVMMPPPDGYDICQRVRADARWKDTKIIMLTARGRDVEREKGLAMGADDYITKPFSTKDVVAQVEKVLGPAEGSRDE